jgi:NADH dehydrogenase
VSGTPPARVVVVGGGFAGVRCARTLRRHLSPARCEIVLFNRENHTVFHPLLAEVAGGSLDPDAVAAALRQTLPAVRCRTEEVQALDLAQSTLTYLAEDGTAHALPYDHVVIACGTAVNLGAVPGMADHAFPLRTLGDAMALRAHVVRQLERADAAADPERRRWLLSFVVVGGGFSGVEVAGEINDLVRGSRRFFPGIAAEDVRIVLVHSRGEILPEIGPALRTIARDRMTRSGIELLLDARVAQATAEGVRLQDGRLVRGATVVCTIGATAAPLVAALPVDKDGGRLCTAPDLRLPGMLNAWAAGDCARIVNAHDGNVCPPTGQFAERQGHAVAENIARALAGRPTRPFRHRSRGQLCSIGGRRAVAEILGVRLAGRFAWFLWRGIYLWKLPSWSRRARVGFDWAWELAFARDLVCLGPRLTERVGSLHYGPGDFVFRQGDPASDFYVVRRGELEVLRSEPAAAPTVLSVLGPGDFFGEMALLSDQPRSASVRARGPVEVVAIGRDAFARISSALAPLRALLEEAVRRRGQSPWDRLPGARQLLDALPLSALMEPLPAVPLPLGATFGDALARVGEHGGVLTCVVDAEGRLCGVVTRTDLLRAFERGARAATPLAEVMVPDPVAVAIDEPARLAATLLRDHELSALPVVASRQDRRLLGHLRGDRLLARMLGALTS